MRYLWGYGVIICGTYAGWYLEHQADVSEPSAFFCLGAATIAVALLADKV